MIKLARYMQSKDSLPKSIMAQNMQSVPYVSTVSMKMIDMNMTVSV